MADLNGLIKNTSITAGTATAHTLDAACRGFCLYAGAATTTATWSSVSGGTYISFFKIGWTGWIMDPTSLRSKTIYLTSAGGPVEVSEIIN
jgi:hypothetical protein